MTTLDVKIGRLQKKVRKLIEQRDHYKEQCEFYHRVLKLYPYAMKRYEDRLKDDATAKRCRELELVQSALLSENEQLKKKLEKFNEHA